jgi:two-component system, LuxR family, sensor kinase FixL
LRKESQAVDGLHLNEVLDELRIIIEPAWAEIGGSVLWNAPKEPLRVLADRYGLLQVFLNLAQNSHRAVQKASTKQLTVAVLEQFERVSIIFQDSGPGIANSHHLFQPFQQDAEVTGLGLFVSRVLVRSYGGELRHQPSDRGCCFTVELPLARFQG